MVLDPKICYFAKNSDMCEYVTVPFIRKEKFFVIDLNKNGLEVDTHNSAIIRGYFNRDSYKLYGWVGAEEGIVVLRRSEISELKQSMDSAEENFFGYNYSPADFFKAFDYNKDNIVDNEDPGYKSLYVWRDTNQDMICQPDEISSFAEVGLNSIILERQLARGEESKQFCTNNYMDSCDMVVCTTDTGTVDLFTVSLLQYMAA